MMQWLKQEQERLLLWLPVLLGMGMLLYFSLPFEPYSYSLLWIGALPFVIRYCYRRNVMAAYVLGVVFTVLCGMLWAKVYTDTRDATMLTKEQKITTVRGRLVEIGDVPEGFRLTLDQVEIERLEKNKTPQRIRVKLRGDGHQLMTGDWVELRAGLLPPTGPVMPGAFDFARFFFFRDIGAVGYAIPPAKVIKASEGKQSSFDLRVTAFRQALSDRVRSQMEPEAGAVATALMTGDRSSISKETAQAMRDTNLSHILAISGMHMAIVTGLVFFALRYVLVLLPFTRNGRYNKKAAAAIALIVGACYLLISGLPLSAVRAFVMVSLMLGAILLDREVSPMRSLMWAAMLLLLYDPSNILEPGFQLSFIATAALIAWYERVRMAADEAIHLERHWRKVMIYIGAILMTTLVAEFATAPFVLYHFNSVSIYGLLANLVVMPIVSFLIMPAIILSFLLMPLGLEAYPLQLVEWGIQAMIWSAKYVANIPYAQFFVPAFPAWGMGIIALGMVWLIIWKGKIRLYGLGVIVIGTLSLLTVHQPDLLISKDGKQIAVNVNGDYVMVLGRARSFIPQQWAHGTGNEVLPYLRDEGELFRCDRLGCVLQLDDKRIAIAKEQEALIKDCEQADIIIAQFYINHCSKSQLIDRDELTKKGSHWVWLGDAMRIESTADVQGKRPWSVHY